MGYSYTYKLYIRREKDLQSAISSIRPEYLFQDGFSIIDGRDRDGFDRDGFDRFGWNRLGVNRSGERWSGRVADGRQGRGVLAMPDGTSYVGAYRDDLRDGWGALLKSGGGEVQFWENGVLKESFPLGGKILSPVREWIFLGRTAKGIPVDGKGRAISADAAWRILEGTFRGGRLVEGTMEGPDGTLYVGRFSEDRLVQGTIRGASGWTYTGGLADGKPEGRGIVLLPDGTRYEGEFKSGVYHGQGVLSRPDGEKFEGTFRDGKPHGIGIYFNGESIERCEYYDGKRIDQAFLIKQENERQIEALRQEREKLAKEKADQAEMARLAAERTAAEQKALASKSSNKLIAGIFGVGAALAGGSVGMSGAEAALFGAKVAGDVTRGDASMSGSKSTAQAIADSRTGGAGAAGAPGTPASGTSGSGTAGTPGPVGFADRMGLAGTTPASGTPGTSGTSAAPTTAGPQKSNLIEMQAQGKKVLVRRDISGVVGSYKAEGGGREDGPRSFLILSADGTGRLFLEKGFTLDFEFTGDSRKEKSFLWGILCNPDGTPEISDAGNMGIVLKSTSDSSEAVWTVNDKNGLYYLQGGVWVHK